MAGYLRVVAMVMGLIAVGVQAEPQTLMHLQGSNTIGAHLGPQLVEAWMAHQGYQDIRTEVSDDEESRVIATANDGSDHQVTISAHGSGTAFTGLHEGNVDVGMASRPIKQKELALLHSQGAYDTPRAEHVIGLDGLAVIVHPDNPVGSLTVTQVRDIFAGHLRNWSQLGGVDGPIHLYARDHKSGTYDTFRSIVLGKTVPLHASAKRYESNDQLSDDVANDPHGIGFTGLPSVRRAKVLAIGDNGTQPITPDSFSIATEDYLLARRLYLYLNPNTTNPLAQEFVEFVHTQHGQRVVAASGFVSQSIDVNVPVMMADETAPPEYRRFVDGAYRVSVNFRFREGRALILDNKAMRDIERLVDYLEHHPQAKRNVMLFGFSDNNETMPFHSVELSVNRADIIADQLLRNDVAPIRVRGFGSSLPLAANDTELGRRKNRRVEVWIKLPEGQAVAERTTVEG